MTLANILLLGIWLFSDLGLKQSIVQSRRGSDQSFLNTAWVVQIIRGGIMWLFALLLALAIYVMNLMHWWKPGNVYAEPLLPAIIVVISFGFLIGGFESTKLATASRNMLLKRVTIIEIGTQVVGILFMLTWAWINRSIWALVLYPIVSGILKMVLSHTALPGENNRIEWDKDAFHEIFHFGKWIFLTSILGFLAINGDRIILGDLVDAKVLGLYSIAYLLFSSMQDVIFKVVDSVAFPVLSEIARNRPADLKKIYYKFRKPIDILTSLALGALVASGDLIVKLLYDDRYLPASHMLQVLSVGLFMTRFNLDKDFFTAIGKPKLMIPINLVNIFTIYMVMPAMFDLFGLEGAIWAIGAGGMLAIPLIIYFKLKNNLFDFYLEIVYMPLILFGYLLGLLVKMLNNYLGIIT